VWICSLNCDYGMYQSFQPEVKALKEFVEARNPALSADLHAASEYILFPALHPVALVDEQWYTHVCKRYADTASHYSQGVYNLEVMADKALNMYIMAGTWTYYAVCFRQCRNIMLELSLQKIPTEAALSDYWDYNYHSLLQYMEQVLFGIRGTVIDSITGAPLQAEVFVENVDTVGSAVCSVLPHCDYYRPIIAGNYTVTFSAPDYLHKTIKQISVENNKATVLDVELCPIPTNAGFHKDYMAQLSITTGNGYVKIIGNTFDNISPRVSVFDVHGRLVAGKSIQCT